MTGIKAGRLFQGVIRVEKYDWRRCYFTAKVPHTPDSCVTRRD